MSSCAALLCRLLCAVGVVAHHQMLYSELTAYKELKHRAQQVESKQDTSGKSGDESMLAGAAGDDTAAELVKGVLEREVVGEDGLLTVYIPLVIEILSNPTKYPCPELSCSATLALAKLMLVRSESFLLHNTTTMYVFMLCVLSNVQRDCL